MELCPCSPDIGDCNRCGKRYPLETNIMSGKPPTHSNPKPGSALAYDAFSRRYEEGDVEDAAKYYKLHNKLKQFEANRSKTAREQGVASRGAYGELRRNVKLTGQARKTRRNKTSGGDIVTHLLTIRNQVKLYHWQTGSFARHKATDDLTAALDTAIDSFVESYMGRYGRPKVSGSIKLHNFSDSAAKTFVAKQTKYLSTELPKKIKSTDSDLLNIRDEILAELTKVSYLFTLQ